MRLHLRSLLRLSLVAPTLGLVVASPWESIERFLLFGRYESCAPRASRNAPNPNKRLEPAMRSYLPRISCLIVIVAGCAGTGQGEEVRDARMARADEHAEVEQEAADRRGEARADAVEQRYDIREDRAEAGARPGEEASEDLVEISRARAEYEQRARARAQTMAIRLQAAREKIEILGGRAPLDLRTELNVAAKQYEAVKEDLAQLDQTPPDAWEETTERLEAREEGFDARMSELEDTIDEQ